MNIWNISINLGLNFFSFSNILRCRVVLEKTLEIPLDCKEIKPVNPKGNQSWIFIGKTDAEAEASIIWPPDANWLIGKDPDAGKDGRQEEKGTTEDDMVGWHHRLDGHEFEQALGVGDGQRSLACGSPRGCRESDMTEWLNWTELNVLSFVCTSLSFSWLNLLLCILSFWMLYFPFQIVHLWYIEIVFCVNLITCNFTNFYKIHLLALVGFCGFFGLSIYSIMLSVNRDNLV